METQTWLQQNMRWVGAAVAVVLVVIVGVLLIDGDDDESDQSGEELVAADAGQVKELAADVEYPVYWAGRRGTQTFEWTRLPGGEVYIRYLTGDAELDDPRPLFLTVASYPVGDALAAIERAAKDADAKLIEVPGGGRALVNEPAPTGVYLAYPGSETQIEVYHPDPAEALQIVTSGDVKRVGP